MPDLLVVSTNEHTAVQLSKIAKAADYRTKVATDLSVASDWIKTRRFDVLLLTAEIEDNFVEILSTQLWSKDNTSQLIVYTPSLANSEESLKRKRTLDILGVQLVSQSDQEADLTTILNNFSLKKKSLTSQFKVMVVEDLSSPRDIICAFIEHLENAEVTGFASAKEALVELENKPLEYSCIVTDINMPEISGSELCKMIRANPKLNHLPIIVLTAYGTADTLLKCLEAGASGFLVKPPSKAHMTRELSRARRIISRIEDPVLVKPEDVELMREILEEKGYI